MREQTKEIAPGTHISSGGLISVSEHYEAQPISDWLEVEAKRFAAQNNFNDSMQLGDDLSFFKHLRLFSEWDV